MSNPTNDVFWVNESKEPDYDSVSHSNDWIYILHDDKEPSIIRYDLFVKQLFPADVEHQMILAAIGNVNKANYELSAAIKDNKRTAIIKSLGNIRFYLRAIQNIYGISDQKILQANAEVNSERYKELTKE